MDFDILSSLQAQQQTTQKLIEAHKQQNANTDDSLLSLATKRGEDKIKFTYFFMKKSLADGLKETLSNAEKKFPNLKGKYYAGILSGKSTRVEVVPIKEASSKVSDLPPEEALKIMQESKLGYFQEGDFTLKTPNSNEYKGFQKELQSYFDQNQALFNYLRQHPEANIELEDLKPSQ